MKKTIQMINQKKSNEQYDEVIAACKEEFISKNKRYGNSLDAYNAMGVLEKIYIKLFRVQTIQEAGTLLVEGETIEKEFPGIINYSLYGMTVALQIESGMRILYEGDSLFAQYDLVAGKVRELFQKKNHDYGEAWRELSISFMTQECLVKYKRMKQIYAELKFKKENHGQLQKDFIEIFSDICNYSIFCSILISEGVNPMI